MDGALSGQVGLCFITKVPVQEPGNEPIRISRLPPCTLFLVTVFITATGTNQSRTAAAAAVAAATSPPPPLLLLIFLLLRDTLVFLTFTRRYSTLLILLNAICFI